MFKKTLLLTSILFSMTLLSIKAQVFDHKIKVTIQRTDGPEKGKQTHKLIIEKSTNFSYKANDIVGFEFNIDNQSKSSKKFRYLIRYDDGSPNYNNKGATGHPILLPPEDEDFSKAINKYPFTPEKVKINLSSQAKTKTLKLGLYVRDEEGRRYFSSTDSTERMLTIIYTQKKYVLTKNSNRQTEAITDLENQNGARLGTLSGTSLTLRSSSSFLSVGAPINAPNEWSFSKGRLIPGITPPPENNIFMNVGDNNNIGLGQNASTDFGQVTIKSSGVPLVFENPSTAINRGGLWRFFQVGDHIGFDVNTGNSGSEFGNNYKRPLRMSDDGSVGRVGIGIPFRAPSYVLDVNGTARVSSLIYNSDKRFKQNITPINNALTKINRLQGVSYSFKGSMSKYNLPKEQQLGLIAQDVQKEFPEIVKKDEQGYLGVDYIKLIPLLIEAVKEQQESIAILKDENEKLKETLDVLLKTKTINTKPNNLENSNFKAKLFQNIPNPLISETKIKYNIPKLKDKQDAIIEIYDANSTIIKRFKKLTPGEGSVIINASVLPSKISFYRLIVNGKIIDTKKMIRK